MNQENYNELVSVLKQDIKNLSHLTSMDDDALRDCIMNTIKDKLFFFESQEDEESQRLAQTLKSLNFQKKHLLKETVFESIRGFGVLGQIMADPTVTEIMVNGYDCVFVEKNGKLVEDHRCFESPKELEVLIQKFVAESGKQVNQSNPIVDTRLPDGSRVNVVLPPIALNGPIVTIRRFSKEGMTMEKLIEYQSITPEIAKVLESLVQSKYNIFVAGGTGSGKTTFLNALSGLIPKEERIITIEDAAELQLEKIKNLVRLETRNPGADGSGEISMTHLIKSALRMRPERIVVGEVRGVEALDMLQAMNTGHDGSLSTGHGNSSRDMLSRLETMVLQGANGLPLEAIRQQIASGVDIIIYLSRLRDKSRRTMEITEVSHYDFETGQIILNPLYQFEESTESTTEKVVGQLISTKNKMIHTEKFQLAGIENRMET